MVEWGTFYSLWESSMSSGGALIGAELISGVNIVFSAKVLFNFSQVCRSNDPVLRSSSSRTVLSERSNVDNGAGSQDWHSR